MRPHARKKDSEAERFSDIIIGAGVKALHRVPFGIMSGQHDDRILEAFLAHPLDRLAAVHVRQADVHDHEIGRLLA